jgi:hypothetical protein
MKAVQTTGYDGPLSLEIFNDQFRAGSAVRTATDGLRSLILLEDRLSDTPDNASAARLQPKARSRGVGFIEFAVSDAKPGICPRCSASSVFAKPVRIAARTWSDGRKAYRTRHQLRARWLCPRALRHAWAGSLRHRDRRR